ncbi:MAG: NADH-quinone oxidoreductase subunit N [Vampirovibrionales bacterium]
MFDLTSVAAVVETSPFLNFMVTNNLPVLSAELMILVTALIVLALSLFNQPKQEQMTPTLTLLGLALSFMTLVLHGFVLFNGDPMATKLVLNGMIQGDLLSVMLRSLVVIGAFASALLAKTWAKQHLPTRLPELFSLLLIATLGALLLCGSNDMVMTFVALETLGITAYLLVGLHKQSQASTEASLKYLIYGGASSAIFLFGMALLYGFSGGHTSFPALFHGLGELKDFAWWQVLAFTCVLTGVGFKLSAAPFHIWSPDVYEASPTPMTLFLATVSKVAALALALRLLPSVVHSHVGLGALIATLSVLSIIVGNVLALRQTSLKRLLAYSSIAHIGYLLLGFVFASQATLGAVVFYLVGYVFMTIASFTSVSAMEATVGSDRIQQLPVFFKQQPVLGGLLAVVFIALAGLPLTAGFFGKVFLFQTLLQTGAQGVGLMMIALLGSLVGVGYYLNVVYQLVKPTTLSNTEPSLSGTSNTAIAAHTEGILSVSVLVTLLLGIVGAPLFTLCTSAVGVALATLYRF